MLLGIEDIDGSRLAAIDSEGGRLTYGEIVHRARAIEENVRERALCFMSVENNVRCVEWVMGAMASKKLVPLIISAKTDKTLYNNLNNVVNNADSLMVDLKAHPKRYVHFSVFGRKDK